MTQQLFIHIKQVISQHKGEKIADEDTIEFLKSVN